MTPRFLLVHAHSIDKTTEPPHSPPPPTPWMKRKATSATAPQNATLRVGWYAADKKSRQAGQEERRDQRRFAADTVAVMAEDRSTDRSGSKADCKDRERLQSPG